ncbi:molybdopterin-guanine dinucleotide biosynthesis protein B [Paenibacillus chondroitinus]|uniref:Molybdopterin-guanine dinucleotide biosynthesis protein B n=1 Tax=Paenibacillus chondroitinus TaxID=59842 RepID=A0ABU6D6M6_9BACL|nr:MULTISPECIES: molybdopterin-guanine dinucleotide biosynthesis protein B [Paenibacillus]MCY9662510.1 molybdopterin-guanine dinucleotide biosynthesis protein B [Paenibacillus anseongense]MEB4793375.1 molybdopterin-guanine dinucleotide biosynthesis protein B [Paenibacillus chondroitinus]
MAHCIGFAGYSGSGKTTLIAKLVIEMKRRGKQIAVLKHDAHGHYKEASGADSTIFAQSGAEAVVTISTDSIHVYEKKCKPDLQEQINAYAHMDYVFVEGFKREKHPKIAVFRTIEQSEIIQALDHEPVAIATDMETLDSRFTTLPKLDLNDIVALADFVERYFKAEQF